VTDPVLHIGYHKTGTSWLQQRCFADETLGYRRIRLLQDGVDLPSVHDFDFAPARCREQMAPELERCERGGLIPVVSSERLSGNPHSGGYDSAVLAERLHQVFPGARVLVMIREQRSMILSSWAQYVKVGGACSLHSYMREQTGTRRPGFRLDHFRYDRLIALYQQRFGSDRVRVELYERLRDDPVGFSQSVATFCGGKAPPVESAASRVNRALGPVALSILRWLNPFVNPDSVNGWSPYGVRGLRKPARALVTGCDALVPGSWKQRLSRRWRDIVETECGDFYASSNDRTARLTGLDLARYGYRLP
jgi:hypothetical protein